MRYRLQRHDGTDCSATMVPITVLRMVPIQRYRQGMSGLLFFLLWNMFFLKEWYGFIIDSDVLYCIYFLNKSNVWPVFL